MRPIWLFALPAALLLISSPATAQIKAGIPLKSKATIAAERKAKADRAAEAERKRAEAFARMDADKDGTVSQAEFHAADEARAATDQRMR